MLTIADFTDIHYYLLGFFYADGCMHKKQKGRTPMLSLTIKSDDNIIADKYREIFGGCTYYVSNGRYIRWAAQTQWLYKLFESIGLMTQKTFKLELLPIIPRKYIKDFIRGYFDRRWQCILRRKKEESCTY